MLVVAPGGSWWRLAAPGGVAAADSWMLPLGGSLVGGVAGSQGWQRRSDTVGVKSHLRAPKSALSDPKILSGTPTTTK